MSNFTARLEKLENKLPDDAKINLIIRFIVDADEDKAEVNYLKPMRELDPMDINCIYVRNPDEAEDTFTNRASEEHRVKINAGKDHVLLFHGSHKMENDWLINNENEKDEKCHKL